MAADPFHVGHVRLLRRIKERWPDCHLTVWLDADSVIQSLKKRPPFMRFEHRREVVESCRYVDRVVVAPQEYAAHLDTFDLMVRGDLNPAWIPILYHDIIEAGKLVVIGRTRGVSSTALRAYRETARRRRNGVRPVSPAK